MSRAAAAAAARSAAHAENMWLPVDIVGAAAVGEIERVCKWLRTGGHVDARTARGDTLLKAAASNGQIEMVQELLQRGASNINVQDCEGYNGLMNAAALGHLATVRLLIMNSANFDLRTDQGATALSLAAVKGQEPCVRELLKAHANAELRTQGDLTALYFAERQGHAAIAELLHQHMAASASPAAPSVAPSPADSLMPLPATIREAATRGEIKRVCKWLRNGHVDARCSGVPTGQPDTLLTAAPAHGQIEMLRELLRRNACVDLPGTSGITALMYASQGQIEMVRELLRRGACVDVQCNSGCTALMHAAWMREVATVRLLISHSANVDLQTHTGEPALMWAVRKAEEPCVRELLRAHANVELRNDEGRTALDIAEEKEKTQKKQKKQRGHAAIAELLRQHMAASASPAAPSVAPPPADSLMPLPTIIGGAAWLGEIERVCKWLRSGGHVDARGARGCTLLKAAASNGQIEMVQELLRRGASNINVRCVEGHTGLMNAALKGHLATVRLLIAHSANVDLQTVQGDTALILAVVYDQEPCVRELLQAHANVELRSGPRQCGAPARRQEGCTALEFAEKEEKGQKCHSAIAELLRQHMGASAPPAASEDGATAADAAHAVVELEGEAAFTASAAPLASSPEPEPLPEDVLEAAGTGDMKRVREWLRTGDVNARTVPDLGGDQDLCNYDVSLLDVAAALGKIKMARELLQLGADVNRKNGRGLTPLMCIMSQGKNRKRLLAMARFLLEHSASVDLQSKAGSTALMLAAGAGNEDSVRTLLDAGADTDLCDCDGDNALRFAEQEGHVSIVTLLKSPEQLEAEAAAEVAEAVKADALQAAQAAQADAMMAELLAEEEAAELAHAAQQASAKSKKAKKKQKKQQAEKQAGESSGASASVVAAPAAPTTSSAPAPPPTPPALAPPSPVARAEVSLRSAMAQGGLSSLEAALEAAPREAREGTVGIEAAARRDGLLEARRVAEEKAKREAAEEARKRAMEERARAEAATKQARAAAAKEAAATKRAAEERARSEAAAAAKAAAAADDDVPDEYVCPITAEIMSDPVCLSDGFTYERAAIAQWLESHNTSPRTGAKLETKMLFPCTSLRILIRKFVEETGRA